MLVLDTATRTPVTALAADDGTLIAERHWSSRHRHGEELLEQLNALLAEAGVARRDIGAVAVGTGPGSFTGLRTGLATAKVIAYGLGVPLLGLSTTLALARTVMTAEAVAVTLPAGAADRYVHRVRSDGGHDSPQLVVPGKSFIGAVGDATLVAVDLDADDIPAAALDRGRAALDGLAASLATHAAEALARADTHDPAELVPAYVALPRGIARAAAELTWSPDLR